MPKNNSVTQIEDLKWAKDISNAVDQELDNILRERFTYTDKSGKTWTVEGLEKNPEKGTYGVVDVFEEPEFKGQPFNEVSRNMYSHFKAYCISRGMRAGDFIQFEGGATNEMKDRLREYKNDFMQMVFEKDLDKISDMYVNLAKEIENDKEQYDELCVNSGMRPNIPLIVKYSGSQSWYSQTIDYKGEKCQESGNKMVEMVNNKLKKEGKDYNFESMMLPLKIIEDLNQITATIDSKIFKEKNAEKNPAIISASQMVNSQIACFKELTDGAKDKKDNSWLANMPTDPNVYINVYSKYLMMSEDERNIKSGKYQDVNILKDFDKFTKTDAIPNQINNIIAAIESSGKVSHRNSDLSGQMYQKLIALKGRVDEGESITEEDMADIKKTATEYLSYKNKEGYNKNAYGKIAAADGIIALANALEARDSSMIKEISADKQAVNKIMETVKKNKTIVNTYNADRDREKVRFTDLLDAEIEKSDKKSDKKKVGISKAEAKNEMAHNQSKGMQINLL